MKYYLILINILSFCLYGIDKQKAKKHLYRISEFTLLCVLPLLGGTLGCILGMFSFHHKTKKLKFRIGLFLILFIQLFIVWIC